MYSFRFISSLLFALFVSGCYAVVAQPVFEVSGQWVDEKGNPVYRECHNNGTFQVQAEIHYEEVCGEELQSRQQFESIAVTSCAVSGSKTTALNRDGTFRIKRH